MTEYLPKRLIEVDLPIKAIPVYARWEKQSPSADGTMTRQQLIQSIATTITDYRKGEIPPPTPEHVDRWIRQFDPSVQDPMLAELDHVFKQSYLSREYFRSFLRGLAGLTYLTPRRGFWQKLRQAFAGLFGLAGNEKGKERGSPTPWPDVNFLNIQKHGASQQEMFLLLGEVLGQDYGLKLSSCGSPTGPFVYLDDLLFTGNRIIADLRRWIQTGAPPRAEVVVVVIASYRRGLWYSHQAILRAAAEARKAICLHWFRSLEFEDRHWADGARDGFHPALIPDVPLVWAYARELAEAGYAPRLRVPGSGGSRLFSSEAGRHLLEQQLLLAGLKIRSYCRNPQEVLRPLGYHTLKSFGFGATVVTYRNCPNNCPLAWWWGDTAAPPSHPLGRWYPLFPRKT
jgi:hypothetical protein